MQQCTPGSLLPWLDQVTAGDCLHVLPQLPQASIDMVFADLPYGTTRNSWDSVIDLDALWEQYWRVLKPTGVIVLTAAQPFTSTLVASQPHRFKYEWIWSKTIGSGQLNIRHQPLRTHESVLVFYAKRGTYHPQMTTGPAYTATRKASTWSERGYNEQRDHVSVNGGQRHPKTVLPISNPRIRGGHPTQKPVDLVRYMIRTYTDAGQVVLDNVIGSGTTGVAALLERRHFVGIENDPKWVDRARRRVAATLADLEDAAGDAV